MHLPEISKEEFLDWKRNHVTVAVLEQVQIARENAKESIANARHTGDNLNQIIGYCVGLNDVLEMKYEDPVEEVQNV